MRAPAVGVRPDLDLRTRDEGGAISTKGGTMGATLSGGGLPLGQALTQPNHFSTDDRWDRTVRRRLGLWLLLLVAVLMSASCTARPPAATTPMAASPSPSASAAATYASESFIAASPQGALLAAGQAEPRQQELPHLGSARGGGRTLLGAGFGVHAGQQEGVQAGQGLPALPAEPGEERRALHGQGAGDNRWPTGNDPEWNDGSGSGWIPRMPTYG